MMAYIQRIYHFYREGFREMKLGKLLWLIILIKLFVIFCVLRLFFSQIFREIQDFC